MVINIQPQTPEEISGFRVGAKPERTNVKRHLSDNLLIHNYNKFSFVKAASDSLENSLLRSVSESYFNGDPFPLPNEPCQYVKSPLPIRTYDEQKLHDNLESKYGTNIKDDNEIHAKIIDAFEYKKNYKREGNPRKLCYVVARQEETKGKTASSKGNSSNDTEYVDVPVVQESEGDSKDKNKKCISCEECEYSTDRSKRTMNQTRAKVYSTRFEKRRMAWSEMKEMYKTPCSSVVSVQQILVKERHCGPSSILTSTTGLVGGNVCACCIPPPCSCPKHCPTCGQQVERDFVTPTNSECRRMCLPKCPVCKSCPAGSAGCKPRYKRCECRNNQSPPKELSDKCLHCCFKNDSVVKQNKESHCTSNDFTHPKSKAMQCICRNASRPSTSSHKLELNSGHSSSYQTENIAKSPKHESRMSGKSTSKDSSYQPSSTSVPKPKKQVLKGKAKATIEYCAPPHVSISTCPNIKIKSSPRKCSTVIHTQSSEKEHVQTLKEAAPISSTESDRSNYIETTEQSCSSSASKIKKPHLNQKPKTSSEYCVPQKKSVRPCPNIQNNKCPKKCSEVEQVKILKNIPPISSTESDRSNYKEAYYCHISPKQKPNTTKAASTKRRQDVNVLCTLCCKQVTENLCNDFDNSSKVKYEKNIMENGKKLEKVKSVENIALQLQKNIKYDTHVINDLIYNKYDLTKNYPNNPMLYPVKRLSESGHRGTQQQMHLQVTNEAGELISMEVVLPEHIRMFNRINKDNNEAQERKNKKLEIPKNFVKDSSEDANTELDSEISLKISSSTFFKKSKGENTSNENKKDGRVPVNKIEEKLTSTAMQKIFANEDKKLNKKWMEYITYEKFKENNSKTKNLEQKNRPRIFISPKTNQPITLNVPLIPEFPTPIKLPKPVSIHDDYRKHRKHITLTKSINSSETSYDDRTYSAQVLFMNNKDIAKRNVSADTKVTEIQTLDKETTFSEIFTNILNSRKHHVKDMNVEDVNTHSFTNDTLFPSYIHYKNPKRKSGESETDSFGGKEKPQHVLESGKTKPTTIIDEDSVIFQKSIVFDSICGDVSNMVPSDPVKKLKDQVILADVSLHDKESSDEKKYSMDVNITSNEAFELSNLAEKFALNSLGILKNDVHSLQTMKTVKHKKFIGDVQHEHNCHVANRGTNPRMIVHSEAPGVCLIRLAEESAKSLEYILVHNNKINSTKKYEVEKELTSYSQMCNETKHENTPTQKSDSNIFLNKYISYEKKDYKSSSSSDNISLITEVAELISKINDKSKRNCSDSGTLIKTSTENSLNSVMSTINCSKQKFCSENVFPQDTVIQTAREMTSNYLKCPIFSELEKKLENIDINYSYPQINSSKDELNLMLPNAAFSKTTDVNTLELHSTNNLCDFNKNKSIVSEGKKDNKTPSLKRFPAARIGICAYPSDSLCFKTWKTIRPQESFNKPKESFNGESVDSADNNSAPHLNAFSKSYTETIFSQRGKTSDLNQMLDSCHVSHKSPSLKTIHNLYSKQQETVECTAGPVLLEKQLKQRKVSILDRNLSEAASYSVIDKDCLSKKKTDNVVCDVETEKIKKQRDNKCSYYVGCVMINNNNTLNTSSEGVQEKTTLLEKTGKDLYKAKIKANAIMKASAEMKKLNFKNYTVDFGRQVKENVNNRSNTSSTKEKFFKKEVIKQNMDSSETNSNNDAVPYKPIYKKEEESVVAVFSEDLFEKVHHETETMFEIFDDINNLIQQCTFAEHNIITTFRNRTIELPRFVKRRPKHKRSFPILNGRVGSNNKLFKRVVSQLQKDT